MIINSLKNAFIASLLIFLSANANAASVGFSVNNTVVNQGDTFSLTVQGSDFATIVGGGLNLAFDASVLQLNSVTINQSVFEFYIGDGTEEGIIDNSFGRLFNTAFGSFIGASGNFDIMDLSFTAVGAGTSSLALSESLLWVFSDDFGNYYGDQISYDAASVSVSAVPVPAAAWLFGSGLIALAGAARRRSVAS